MSRQEAEMQKIAYREMSDVQLMLMAEHYDKMETIDGKEHSELIHRECDKRSECYL